MRRFLGMRGVGVLVACVLAAVVAARQTIGSSVGDKAPLFSLQDSSNRTHKLQVYAGKFVVLEWTNKGCPYVKKHYDSKNLQTTQAKAKEMGAVWLTICSSAYGKEGHMRSDEIDAYLKLTGFAGTAYLVDSEGRVARAYKASTTPYFVIIDPSGRIIYTGALDDKPTLNPADIKKARNHVLRALSEAMERQPVTVPTSPPYGSPIRF